MGTKMRTMTLIGVFVVVLLCGSLAENDLVLDASGNANNATAHNGPTVAAGRFVGSSALEFNDAQHLLATLDLNGD